MHKAGAAQQAAVTEIGRLSRRPLQEASGRYRRPLREAGGRYRRPLQEAGGGDGSGRYINNALRQDASTILNFKPLLDPGDGSLLKLPQGGFRIDTVTNL